MYVTLSQDIVAASQAVPSKRDGAKRTGPGLVPLKEGQTLFFDGDPAQAIYEVASGVLRLSRVMENGRRQVISFGYPGDFVGFPKDGQHHADCDALEAATVVRHSLTAWANPASDPSLHRRLLQAALVEINAMQDHFMTLGRKSSYEKVASFLAALGLRSGVRDGRQLSLTLPMSRCDIADFLGLTTETVSRTLSQLRRSGLIRFRSATALVVPDTDALCRAGGGF